MQTDYKKDKMQIYKKLVRPVSTYKKESWTLIEHDQERIRRFERKIIKRIYEAVRMVLADWRIRSNNETVDILNDLPSHDGRLQDFKENSKCEDLYHQETRNTMAQMAGSSAGGFKDNTSHRLERKGQEPHCLEANHEGGQGLLGL
ncbi:hypothetical protein HHI36_000186 [Cryptolaemus montrouzieri]|uniref:Uncharacterized protein n=1 Tax=Cryptolaemus montrouzieri TaxID=559131 RepID=A0ABD2P4H5_9CUCU